jgi:seryl-tRNA synthetase
MLDINRIRTERDQVERALAKRGEAIDLGPIVALDAEARALQKEFDELRAAVRSGSTRLGELKRAGQSIEGMTEELGRASARAKEVEARLDDVRKRTHAALELLPNIPDDDVPAGGKENNVVLRTWGEPPALTGRVRDHVELSTSLGLVDFERGVKLGGSGFWVYRGAGARLEWALVSFFIEEHIEAGYELVLPPHILGWQCGYAAGQFPKFAQDVFLVRGEARSDRGPDDAGEQFLLPTAETALVNLHRDEILDEDALPLRYCSYTPCYRREGGGYRSEERGTVRGHQFNKVELVMFTTPEQSAAAFDELVGRAESLVRALGLHHRVAQLAAEDCSASMARTYDVEVWIPSMGVYKEVSSVSSARDYQARRGAIRFRRTATKKGTEHVHTLNASGLATSRLLPAILEQFQRSDGSVGVPEVLQRWVGAPTIAPR